MMSCLKSKQLVVGILSHHYDDLMYDIRSWKKMSDYDCQGQNQYQIVYFGGEKETF